MNIHDCYPPYCAEEDCHEPTDQQIEEAQIEREIEDQPANEAEKAAEAGIEPTDEQIEDAAIERQIEDAVERADW